LKADGCRPAGFSVEQYRRILLDESVLWRKAIKKRLFEACRKSQKIQ
jgi:hypothetical protein